MNRDRLLQFIRTRPHPTYREMSGHLGVAVNTITGLLKTLEKRGYIKFEKVGKLMRPVAIRREEVSLSSNGSSTFSFPNQCVTVKLVDPASEEK